MNEELKAFLLPRVVLTASVLLLMAALTAFIVVKTVSEIKAVSNLPVSRTISISGEGSVFAKPDIGKIVFAVVHDGETADSAAKAAAIGINDIIAFLEASGIDKKDIKTTGYSANPVYDYTQNGRVFKGYEVRQSLEIKIRDIAKAGEIIGGAVRKGANQVGELSLTTENPEALKAEARKKAIDDAKEKARILARDLGVRLDDLAGFSESSGGVYPIYARAFEMSKGSADIAPEIPAGENEIKVSVTLTYEIK